MDRQKAFKKYFDEMEISAKQKEEREELSEELYLAILFSLLFIKEYKDKGLSINQMYVIDMTMNKYTSVIDGHISRIGREKELGIVVKAKLKEMARKYINDFVESTLRNIDKDYFLSDERVVLNAENQANTTLNYLEYELAKLEGKTRKEWVSMRDNKERPTHREADKTIIPIDEPFVVGSSYLMFPKDESLGASADEIVNCRCSVRYW